MILSKNNDKRLINISSALKFNLKFAEIGVSKGWISEANKKKQERRKFLFANSTLEPGCKR